MKRILILVAINLFLCSTASAFQGGGGEATKNGSNKKKEATKKKTSGTKSNNTTPPKPPASPLPTRTPATVKEQAADRERQYEAIRIAGIAERTRIEQGIAGEWSDGPSRLTIARDGGKFSGVYVSGAKNVLGELLPQSLRGELLPDNRLRLANDSYGKLVNPRYYYDGDFDQEAWIELGVDGGSLIVRFSEAKGGRSLVMKRISGNADSRVPTAPNPTPTNSIAAQSDSSGEKRLYRFSSDGCVVVEVHVGHVDFYPKGGEVIITPPPPAKAWRDKPGIVSQPQRDLPTGNYKICATDRNAWGVEVRN